MIFCDFKLNLQWFQSKLPSSPPSVKRIGIYFRETAFSNSLLGFPEEWNLCQLTSLSTILSNSLFLWSTLAWNPVYFRSICCGCFQNTSGGFSFCVSISVSTILDSNDQMLTIAGSGHGPDSLKDVQSTAVTAQSLPRTYYTLFYSKIEKFISDHLFLTLLKGFW